MKNNSSKKSILYIILISSLCMSFKLNDYPQINAECGTDFHGVGEINIGCYEEIKITSLPEDGSSGSAISGIILSSNKIRVTPGTSSVKIVKQLNRTILKTVNESTLRKYRTKENGNGGNTRKESETKNTDQTFDYTINNQNLIISNLNSVIIHYTIHDMQGILITEVNNIRLTNNTIPIDQLQNNLYIVKIQLKNGDVLTKTIAKI